MNYILNQITQKIYDKTDLIISDFLEEAESKEYEACRFRLGNLNVISRNAKITSKKIGQFVTFWKRKDNGPIEPFQDTDPFDLYIVNVVREEQIGQFVFPKDVLIKKGIISTSIREGKRAFRIYPSWDIPASKQAGRTQKWQLNYFIIVNNGPSQKEVRRLYGLD